MPKQKKLKDLNLNVAYVEISKLKSPDYNPRRWSDQATKQLKASLRKHGFVEPIVLNKAKDRKNIIIGGNFRVHVAKKLGYKKVPAVYINIPDLEKEKEINLRLNKNTGEFDPELLAEYDEIFLADVGFDSEELDEIFMVEDEPEMFDLKRELEKLDIKKVKIKKGDIIRLDENRLMCGDSTKEEDILRLMDGKKADLCLTDPPYDISYVDGGKRKGKPTTGFGHKKNRRYLETEVIPDDFTQKWMANIAKVQKKDFSIICYENWKNLRNIWNEMEKYWQVKNMLVWHLPNRSQGFAAKNKFFSKYDIAMVAQSDSKKPKLNLEDEDELLQNEYETALYAISGKPHWESYEKGKKICPTDFIEHNASDEKSSGQGVVFGTKPVEILVLYIKVLTKRGDLIVEPFGGSGSTLIAARKMNRRCYLMEKSPVYCEVIKKRWEKLTKKKGEILD